MKNWLKGIFYAPKHSRPTDENILRLLLPSFVGIIICMVCLAGTTWAWFSATIQTTPQTIEAASFDISAVLTGEADEPVSPGQPLRARRAYKVTLTATGTAPSGGYCIVTNDTGTASLYTATILPDKPLTFTLIPGQDAVYTFTAVWGKYSGEADITDGCTIEKQAETPPAPKEAEEQQPADNSEAIYVVQSDDSLWEIAKQYDTTVDKLAAYNSIENPGALQIGQEIKIPPADYEIPADPIPQENSEPTPESEGSTENAIGE